MSKESDKESIEFYKEVIDYLPSAKQEELVGIALETAKSNPKFFISALKAIQSRGVSNLANLVAGQTTSNVASFDTWGFPLWKKPHCESRYDEYYTRGGIVIPKCTELLDVFALAVSGRPVNAIKEFRNLTNTGLKEAKDLIDIIRLDSNIQTNYHLLDIKAKCSMVDWFFQNSSNLPQSYL